MTQKDDTQHRNTFAIEYEAALFDARKLANSLGSKWYPHVFNSENGWFGYAETSINLYFYVGIAVKDDKYCFCICRRPTILTQRLVRAVNNEDLPFDDLKSVRLALFDEAIKTIDGLRDMVSSLEDTAVGLGS